MSSDEVPIELKTVVSRIQGNDLPDWVDQDDDSDDRQAGSGDSTTWVDDALDEGKDSGATDMSGSSAGRDEDSRLTVTLPRHECTQCGTATTRGFHPGCEAPVILIDEEWRCAKCGSRARPDLMCDDCGSPMATTRVDIPLDMGLTADPATIEKKVHDETNRRRANHDLDQLEYDDHLSAIAFQHSRDMAQRDFFDHTSPDGDDAADRYREYGHDTRSAGENIARIHPDRDAPPTEAAEQVVDNWMNSPGHRENILRDRFKKEGIGIYFDSNGYMYATQNFY